MSEAFLDFKKGGGLELNDIIEDFKYVYKGQSVKAGDFVNYINGVAGVVDYGTSTDTVIDGTNAYTGTIISAVALDDSRVFIAHSRGSTYQLYGVVCTINGAKITKGTDTEINGNGYTGDKISAVALDDTRIFVAHSNGSSSNSSKCVKGIVCTVSGTAITVGTDTQITSASYTGFAFSSCLLPDGKVLIAHSYGSNYYLYGVVCTISGTSITTGTDTTISSSSRAGFSMSTCLLQDGKVFIAHSYGTNYYLYGIVCAISGTTIGTGSDTTLNTTTARTGEKISTTLLPDGKVFIANSYSTSYSLYGTVCSISNVTITKGGNIQINANTYSGFAFSAITLQNGNVFIAFCTDSSKFLSYGVVCKVSGTEFTIGTATELNANTYTGYDMSAIALNNGTIFIAHTNSNSQYLNAQIWGIDEDNNIPTNHIVATEYETQVTPATESPFNAIALSSGEGSPEYVEGEVEVAKTDNIFPHTAEAWTEVVAGTKYSSAVGYILEASSDNNSPVYLACDGNTGTTWLSAGYSDSATEWLMMTCPEPQKITKMKTKIYGGSGNFYNASIQGSKNGTNWTKLYTLSAEQSTLTEITLENADYYSHYRIYINLMSKQASALVDEWQVSEYIGTEIQLVPSTSHKDQVKIARVYKERTEYITGTGNIFPTSWNAVTNYTKYSSADGYILEASSGKSNALPTYACDGVVNSNSWTSDDSSVRSHWLKMTCPNPTKIAKMNVSLGGTAGSFNWVQIQGSVNGSSWVALYTFMPNTDSEGTINHNQNMVEVTLSNVSYYSYYRLLSSHDVEGLFRVYGWETTGECTQKITEVIT